MSTREPTEEDAGRVLNWYMGDRQLVQTRTPPYYTPTQNQSMLSALKALGFVLRTDREAGSEAEHTDPAAASAES